MASSHRMICLLPATLALLFSIMPLAEFLSLHSDQWPISLMPISADRLLKKSPKMQTEHFWQRHTGNIYMPRAYLQLFQLTAYLETRKTYNWVEKVISLVISPCRNICCFMIPMTRLSSIICRERIVEAHFTGMIENDKNIYTMIKKKQFYTPIWKLVNPFSLVKAYNHICSTVFFLKLQVTFNQIIML